MIKYNHNAKVRQSGFVLVAEENRNISLYKQTTAGTSVTIDGRLGWGVK